MWNLQFLVKSVNRIRNKFNINIKIVESQFKNKINKKNKTEQNK